MQILVFKTNLFNARHIRNVKPALNRHPAIREWNVDRHDQDNVLRVVADSIDASEIENLVILAGYECKELQ